MTANQAGADTAQTAPPPRRGGPMSGGLGLIVAVVVFGVAGYLVSQLLRNPPPTAPLGQDAIYICSETLKTFPHQPRDGERTPVYSPHSKKSTGYPAEKCYWTKDGKAKREPTYVLLNSSIGKEGPTYCPDCGREVKPHNEPPTADLMQATRDR